MAGPRFNLDPVSRGDELISDAEREYALDALRRHAADGRLAVQEFSDRSEEALMARTADQLGASLRDLPQQTYELGESGAGARRSTGRPRWIPLPILMLLVVALVASHGWAIVPLAWLLFAVFGPWRRRHEGRYRRTRVPL
ncbi:MAG: DUF1707 SHOCT-like domain-containing protein [Dehalococcoidia bacterium]